MLATLAIIFVLLWIVIVALCLAAGSGDEAIERMRRPASVGVDLYA